MLCHCGTALTMSFEERDIKKLHKRQVVTRKYLLERGGKKKKKNRKPNWGEIIRSTWWTSDVVHYSTKKLSLV